MVSILMPSLNQSRFLPAALNSVLHQSHRDLELIVADGGSTDGSVEILQKRAAQDPRLRWSSEPDSGPAGAVNKAAAMAQGEIIGWLNADDLYAQDAVETVLQFFAQEPEAVFAYGHARLMDGDGNKTGFYPTKGPEATVEDFTNGCFICQPTAFFRGEVWSALGGLDESLRTSFDFDCWIRMFRQFPGRIGFIDHILASSRRHAHTITAQRRNDVALEGLTVLRRHLGCTPSHWILTNLEEIMGSHPHDSPQDLRTRVETLLEEARQIVQPQDFALLAQRAADDRRLALAGPDSFIEVYPDGWAGAILKVRFRVTASQGLRLVCRSGLPSGRRHQLRVIFPAGRSSHITARGEREFQVTLTAPPLPAHTCVVFTIESRDTFVPAEHGPPSDDRRELSFQVLASAERP